MLSAMEVKDANRSVEVEYDYVNQEWDAVTGVLLFTEVEVDGTRELSLVSRTAGSTFNHDLADFVVEEDESGEVFVEYVTMKDQRAIRKHFTEHESGWWVYESEELKGASWETIGQDLILGPPTVNREVNDE